jgi:hypothetical protein
MSDESPSGACRCIECGSDLTDPKNRGDPDVDGDWVCSEPICRAMHDTEMTCGPDAGGSGAEGIDRKRFVKATAAAAILSLSPGGVVGNNAENVNVGEGDNE